MQYLTCNDETVKYLRHGLRLLPRLLPLPPLLLDGSQLELVVLTLLPSVSVLGLLGLLHKVLQLLKIFSGGNIGLDLVHWNKVCFQIRKLNIMDLSNLLLDSRVQMVDWMFLTRSEMPAEELEGSENVLFIYFYKNSVLKIFYQNVWNPCSQFPQES